MPGTFAQRCLAGFAAAVAAAGIALGTGGSAVWVAVVVLLLLLSGATLLGSVASLARSARALARAHRDMSEGQLGVRVDTSDADLGQVAAEFNRMASSVEQRVGALSQERNRLLAAIDSSVDAIVAVDEGNNVTFANAAVEPILGHPPAAVTGRPFVWLLPMPQLVQALRDSRESGVSSSHIFQHQAWRFLSAFVTPIRGGGDWTSLLVLHDVTDAKRLEEVRRDFVANVSHELRTPLAALKSVIETLQAGALDDRVAADDFLVRADAEIDRLVQMVEELLELSRLESGELELRREDVDVGEVVGAAVRRLRPQAEKAGVTLTLQVAADVPRVKGERASLESAVANLIHNAIKFTSEGGTVDIAAERMDGGVQVRVRDTGVGIEARDLPRIFERFYKADRARQAGGTGLGLALVKHTIEAHGGRVQAESRPGSGSTFSFWLPAS